MGMQLIERLTDTLGYALLDADNFEQFVAHTPQCVLFFTENPASFPESSDVAVILPEIVRLFGDRLTPAVVSRGHEREVSKRYGVREWPTLVFLRHGEYLGAIARVQDWNDYVLQIRDILAGETRRPPTVGIPVIAQAQLQETHQ
jgi:hydrogenase-1 operon protein HyaE